MIQRLDEKGCLYFMDYTGDFYDPGLIRKIKKAAAAKAGCSCFLTHNEHGHVLTCRNYDLGHRVSENDPEFTGLNVILHCQPKDKYESIGVCDAVWIDPFNPLFQSGGPDKEGFSTEMFSCLPYVCMDGINEKGLCANLLKVEIKDGEQPQQTSWGPGFILRHILDSCANVEEAVELVGTCEIRPADWQECHIFVTDENGNSAVLESCSGRLCAVKTDIVTNFFQCRGDMADSHYSNGALREKAVYMADINGEKRYTFGHGHGYHRFVGIQSQLEMHRDLTSETFRTVMPEDHALVVLRSAAQNPYTKAAGTSVTQYTIIYNNTERTMKAWSFQDFSKSFCYDITGKPIL